MQDDEDIGSQLSSSNEILLWIAIVLALVFLGLLVFDFLRRRKHRRRHRTASKGLRTTLLEPFRRGRALRRDVMNMLREHSRRRRRQERQPPELPD